MKNCSSCGLAMEDAEDFALEDTSHIYCQYCTDKYGYLLPYDQILEMTAKFYEESQNISRNVATKIADNLLKSHPAWIEEK